MVETYSAIIVAAGKGTRCSLPLNKVYYEVNGKPIIGYSLEVFILDKRCEKIVIVYHQEDEELILKYTKKYTDNRIVLCKGGAERHQSVLNGLQHIDSEYVLIHDGARPNISDLLIDRVLKGFDESDSVSLGVKVTDTIKKVTDKVETVNRDNLYYMQTPQGCKKQLLTECLEKVNENKDMITDDLMAIEKYSNVIPKIVIGEKSNIKITTLEDINLIKYYLE